MRVFACLPETSWGGMFSPYPGILIIGGAFVQPGRGYDRVLCSFVTIPRVQFIFNAKTTPDHHRYKRGD